VIAQITCQSIRSTVRAAATRPIRSPSSHLDTVSTSAACTKAPDRLGNHIDAVVGGMAVSDEDFTRADRSRLHGTARDRVQDYRPADLQAILWLSPDSRPSAHDASQVHSHLSDTSGRNRSLNGQFGTGA
jgi:hypothetical protein